MADQNVLRQRKWTPEELIAAGFRYYSRRKQIVMARELSASEAPKTIKAPWATLVAEAGVMIVYNPSFEAKKHIDDYDHWPVQADLFEETYRPWDRPDRTLTPAEMHLRFTGCKPYYKYAGAWAKRLAEPQTIQSLESPEPTELPAGAWLLIGSHGEPWGVDDESFQQRYVIDKEAAEKSPDPVLRTRDWTEEELQSAGFRRYERKKYVVMARPIMPEEAPLTVRLPWRTFTVEAGHYLCYIPGDTAQEKPEDYEHWPVTVEHFEARYLPWDDPAHQPTPAEEHLRAMGCQPYYRTGSTWARLLAEDTLIQEIDSPDVVQLPAGTWLLIGSRGEPWGQDDESFRQKFIMPDEEAQDDSAGA